MTKRWPSVLVAFLLWTAAGLSLAYWAMKLAGVSEQALSADPVASQGPSVGAADVARVLGPGAATPVAAAVAVVQAPEPSVKMQLLGIVADRRNIGVALIAVEGQPARPHRVGSQVAGLYTLSQIARRSATLSPIQQGAPAITLELASVTAQTAPRQAGLGAVISPVPGTPAGTAPGTFQGIVPGLVTGTAPPARPAVPAGTDEPAQD